VKRWFLAAFLGASLALCSCKVTVEPDFELKDKVLDKVEKVVEELPVKVEVKEEK
jgi:hypothetical protein